MQATPEDVRECAKRVRKALEEMKPADLPIGLKQFPRGACGDACLLLGAALADRNLGEFRYVCGHNYHEGKPESHAWLVGEGLIIDITADQFGAGMPPVFVESRSAWHARWEEVDEMGPADYRQWRGHTLHEIGAVYETIKLKL